MNRPVLVGAAALGYATLFAGCTQTRSTDPAPASGTSEVATASLVASKLGELGVRTGSHHGNLPPGHMRERAKLSARAPQPRPEASREALAESAAKSPHWAPKLEVLTGGVPSLASPKIVPILFPGDNHEVQLREFFAKVPGSTYWKAVVGEYGVGDPQNLPFYLPDVTLHPTPTLDTVDRWVLDEIARPGSTIPRPDGSTIYVMVFPLNWEIARGVCKSFGGYHSYAQTPAGASVYYTVNPICEGYLGIPAKDAITNAISHELVETVTDNFADPLGRTGYGYVNWALSGWGSAAEASPGGELADLCEYQTDASYIDPQIGMMVQRSWSNTSAAGGHDPCLPLLPSHGTYFNTDVLVPDGTLTPYGAAVRGLSIEPGAQATVPVRLYADGPSAKWNVSALEIPNAHFAPDKEGLLSFSWDEPSGRAGDIRHLTIKRAVSTRPSYAQEPLLRVGIVSTRGSVSNISWLIVGRD